MPPAKSLPRPSRDWALFLDVDGTLIEIAPSPGEVHVDARTGDILARLHDGLGGALALVSGRPVATLDALFAPLKLAAAGLHGLERRGADGAVVREAGLGAVMDEVRGAAADFAAATPGILVEDKGLTVALHYRGVPERETDALAFARDTVRRLDHGLVLQQGKMVVELRPAGPDKGDVVDAFMAAPPFAGRTPVFVGDDVTDEDGFAAVNRLGGHSIRVGRDGASAAGLRINSVAALGDWLEAIADATAPDKTRERA